MRWLTMRHAVGMGLFACIVALGLFMHTAKGVDDGVKPTVFINLTSGKEDLHAVTMSYQLAGHALEAGRKVVLFFNVRAPELVDGGLSREFQFRDNPPLREMLSDLIGRGAQVIVCPHCLEAMGVEESNLADGASVATAESLFGNLGQETVVFTY